MTRKILHLLLLGGLILWSMAPVLAFIQQAAPDDQKVIQICTANGLSTIAVDGDGKPAPAHKGKVKCVFCTVVAFGGGMGLDGPDVTAWQKHDYPPQVVLRLAARDFSPLHEDHPGRPVPARAPPVFS